MKNLAILAVAISILNGAAIAESAFNESPPITLAYHSNIAAPWIATATANNVMGEKLERAISTSMEKISTDLEEKLKNKVTREIEYAMQ